jgi:hypothetical protein
MWLLVEVGRHACVATYNPFHNAKKIPTPQTEPKKEKNNAQKKVRQSQLTNLIVVASFREPKI